MSEDTSITQASRLLDIKFLRADDWEGLYVNGALRREGHSLDTDSVLEALGIEFTSHDFTEDQMEDLGCSFPDDIKKALAVLG